MNNLLIAPVMILIATSFDFTTSQSEAFAQDSSLEDSRLSRIQGNWNNDNSGDNILIERDQIGGWDIWIGSLGQGRISNSATEGANVRVDFRNIECSFYVSIASSHRMMWKLVAGRGDCSSLQGVFERVANATDAEVPNQAPQAGSAHNSPIVSNTDDRRTVTEVTYSGDLPPNLNSSIEVSFNGTHVVIQNINRVSKVITFLGPHTTVKDGMNILESLSATWGFWWENSKLQYFGQPYAQGHSYAIIAAIDDYDRESDPEHRGKTGYSRLTRMVAGAEELRKALVRLGFDNILSLYNDKATSKNIEAAIHEFWVGGKHSDADRVFIYFGGHGDQTSGPGTGFLVTYDYDKNDPGTRYEMSRFVFEHFPNISARSVMVALDACSSGFAIPQLQGPDYDRTPLERFITLASIKAQSERKARNLLVASTDAEPAVDYQGGIFTQALVAGLNGDADLLHNGVILFSELALRVHQLVTASALALHQRQEPAQYVARGPGEGGEVLFLTGQQQ